MLAIQNKLSSLEPSYDYQYLFILEGKRFMLRGRNKFAIMTGALLAFTWMTPALAQTDEPTMTDVVRGINTVWVLVAAFLVFFMQAGFALVESGFTRSKNAINIMMKNIMDFVMATIAFWAIG